MQGFERHCRSASVLRVAEKIQINDVGSLPDIDNVID